MKYLVTNHRLSLVLYLGAFSQTFCIAGGLIALACEKSPNAVCNSTLLAIYLMTPSLAGGLLATVFYVGYPFYISNLSNP
jgi:hypothetical protein